MMGRDVLEEYEETGSNAIGSLGRCDWQRHQPWSAIGAERRGYESFGSPFCIAGHSGHCNKSCIKIQRKEKKIEKQGKYSESTVKPYSAICALESG